MPILDVPPATALGPKAFVFDADGTLVDSFEAITASVNHVRGLRGLEPWTREQVQRCVGNGVYRLLELSVEVGDLQANVDDFIAHHPTVLTEGTRLLPGVDPTLAELRRLGRRLAICSNKPVALTRQLVADLGLSETFECVLGPEMVPHRKPAPDMLLLALDRLGVRADEALYVGDMTIDVQTARAAGVSVCILPSGTQDVELILDTRPDRVLERFDELVAIAHHGLLATR